MKKLIPVILISVGISFGLAISPLPVMAQGVVSSLFPSVAKLTVTAPTGTNGIQLNAGARINLGSTAYSAMYLSGTNILDTQGYIRPAFGMIGPVALTAAALPTCAAGYERLIQVQSSTGGTNSGSQTRVCVCVSDGAASPTYSWRNVVSGTAGNATTCNP